MSTVDLIQVKEAVQEKLMSEEELEARREEARREEAKKHRWGPFGIFPGGK